MFRRPLYRVSLGLVLRNFKNEREESPFNRAGGGGREETIMDLRILLPSTTHHFDRRFTWTKKKGNHFPRAAWRGLLKYKYCLWQKIGA